jgi:hypothetical protein
MHGRTAASTAWLSLTPEPERNLPELLARLGGRSPRLEADRMSRIVLRGTPRRWLRHLDRAAAFALEVADGTRDGDPELALVVVEVVLDHDRMLIGLPGRAYHRTSERRRALRAARGRLLHGAGGLTGYPVELEPPASNSTQEAPVSSGQAGREAAPS